MTALKKYIYICIFYKNDYIFVYSNGKISAVKEMFKALPSYNWFYKYKAINPTAFIYGSR